MPTVAKGQEDVPVTWDEMNAIIRMLMKIDATLEELRDLFLENDEEEEAEP
jgi:hypothetical protein